MLQAEGRSGKQQHEQNSPYLETEIQPTQGDETVVSDRFNIIYCKCNQFKHLFVVSKVKCNTHTRGQACASRPLFPVMLPILSPFRMHA